MYSSVVCIYLSHIQHFLMSGWSPHTSSPFLCRSFFIFHHSIIFISSCIKPHPTSSDLSCKVPFNYLGSSKPWLVAVVSSNRNQISTLWIMLFSLTTLNWPITMFYQTQWDLSNIGFVRKKSTFTGWSNSPLFHEKFIKLCCESPVAMDARTVINRAAHTVLHAVNMLLSRTM